MTVTKFDARQTISRDLLDQLSPAANKELDDLLRSINSELTPPARMHASSSPDRIVHIDAVTIVNPETGRNRIPPSVNGKVPAFSSGTVTFPAVAGSNIVVSAGTNVPLVMPVSSYMKVQIAVDADANIVLGFGSPAGSAAAAGAPELIDDAVNSGFVLIQTDGSGNLFNIASAALFQEVGGGGGGGGSVKDLKIGSIITPNLTIKGGAVLNTLSRKTAVTYDGSGTSSSDIRKDFVINLNNVLNNSGLGSSPANATSYALYLDWNSIQSSITITETGEQVYPITEASFYLSTLKPEQLSEPARYQYLGMLHTATSGNAWSGAGAAQITATKTLFDVPSVLANPIVHRVPKTLIGDIGAAGQIRAGHRYTSKSFPASALAGNTSWWHLAGNLNDGSTNTYNLASIGSPTFSVVDIFGIPNNAIALNGTSQYLAQTTQPDYALTSQFKTYTIGGWFNAAWATNVSNQMFMSLCSASQQGIEVALTAADTILVRTKSQGSQVLSSLTSTTSLGWLDNEWHFIAVSYSADSSVRLVVDNRVIKVYTQDQGINNFSSGELRFGADSGGINFFLGVMSELFATVDVNYSDDELIKLGSTRFDYNTANNLKAEDQEWNVNLYSANGLDTEISNAVLDKSRPGSMFASLYSLSALDSIDLSVKDVGFSAQVIPVSNLNQTYDTTTGGTIQHNLVKKPTVIEVYQENGSGLWERVTGDIGKEITFTPTGTWTPYGAFYGRYRKCKNRIRFNGDFGAGGTTTSTLQVQLPPGIVYDTTTIIGDRTPVGVWDAEDASINSWTGVAVSLGTNQLLFTQGGSGGGQVNATSPFTFNAGDSIRWQVDAAIAEWRDAALVKADDTNIYLDEDMLPYDIDGTHRVQIVASVGDSAVAMESSGSSEVKLGYLKAVNGAPSAGQFRSVITNRAPMVDITNDLSTLMGCERIMLQGNIVPVLNEHASGLPVFKMENDPFGRIRFAGSWRFVGPGDAGTFQYSFEQDDFVEITFIGTGLSMLHYIDATARSYSIYVDGVAPTTLNIPSHASDPITNRGYASGKLFNVKKGLSYGLHTIRIVSDAGSPQFNIFALDVLNESTTVHVRPGNAIVDGLKRSVSTETSSAYNSGFRTQYGVPGVRGGNALVYLGRDGVVAKDVQWVDAASLSGSSTDHSNEEVIRTHHFREFGGAGSQYGLDLYGLTNTPARDGRFTLDDGITSMTVDNLGTALDDENGSPNDYNGHDMLYSGNGSMFIRLTAVCSGLDMMIGPVGVGTFTGQVQIDGGAVVTIGSCNKRRLEKIVSGLPYQQHTFTILYTGGAPSMGVEQFVLYGPKTPQLPNGALALSSYNIMSTYSFVDDNGWLISGGIQIPSAGTVHHSPDRDVIYNGTWSAVVSNGNNVKNGYLLQTSTSGDSCEIEFNATAVELYATISGPHDIIVYLDGALYTGAATLSTGSSTWTPGTSTWFNNDPGIGSKLAISGLSYGSHTVKLVFNIVSGPSSFAGFACAPLVHSHKMASPITYGPNWSAVGSQTLKDLRSYGDQIEMLPVTSISAGNGTSHNVTSTIFIPLADMSATIYSKTGIVDVNFDAQIRGGAGNVYFALMLDGRVSQVPSSGGFFDMQSSRNDKISLHNTLLVGKGWHTIYMMVRVSASNCIIGDNGYRWFSVKDAK